MKKGDLFEGIVDVIEFPNKGVIAGLAINNLALGVALGLISGSLTKLKNKDKK